MLAAETLQIKVLDHVIVSKDDVFSFRHLLNRGIRPIGPKQREQAFEHVMNYFNQNQEEMKRIIETEVDVSLEKESYILTGKIDLLLGGDGKIADSVCEIEF